MFQAAIILQIPVSVRERSLRATWALQLWPTWLVAAVREWVEFQRLENSIEKQKQAAVLRYLN